MTLAWDAAGAALLVAVAPLAVWAERRVKALTQLRIGPPPLQVYRDLRRLLAKAPLVPDTASPFFLAAPAVGLAVVAAALFTLPLGGPVSPLGGGAALLVLGLLLTLQRALAAAQAYDTGTPFGGLGASRELFLGGLGEPVVFLVAGAVFLGTGLAAPVRLDLAEPSSWLVAAAVVILLVAEAARIPFDNPATHLELTMVHEALILEASGHVLAVHEVAAAVKQALLAALVLVFVLPLPAAGPARVLALAAGVIVLSGLVALGEATLAKVRLFRASHLLVMAGLLAFLAGAITYLGGPLP